MQILARLLHLSFVVVMTLFFELAPQPVITSDVQIKVLGTLEVFIKGADVVQAVGEVCNSNNSKHSPRLGIHTSSAELCSYP